MAPFTAGWVTGVVTVLVVFAIGAWWDGRKELPAPPAAQEDTRG